MDDHRIETVEIRTQPAERKQVLANLLQLYLHDVSGFADVRTEHGELGPDGRFTYEWFDLYWTEADRKPLTIWADGRLAGLALINRWAFLDRSLDWAMAEFFVVRKYRRHGVGSRAAALAFARFPGRWQVPVAGYNARALAFWRRAIRNAIGCSADEITNKGERWPGTVLCFDTAPARRT